MSPPLRIVVCAKQVPDPEAAPRLDPVTFRMVREGTVVLDDADAAGIEVGLQLGGGHEAPPGGGIEAPPGGGNVIVLVSMAAGGELGGVRKGLALGASSAVVVSDEALVGADALTTARVLAAAVRRVGPVDVVIAGTVSVDGYTGVLASQLAELLGLPAMTFVRRVRLEDGRLRAERETETGHDEVECALPCLVSVITGSVTPRYPSYKAIVGARAKPVEVLGLAELGLAAPVVGQEVVSVAGAAARAGGEVVDDDGRSHERILDLLARLKVV